MKISLEAGKLDRQLTLLKRSESLNELNERDQSLVEVATVPCQSKPQRGRELQKAGREELDQYIDLFVIRYRPDVKEDLIIDFEGTQYDIVSIAEMGRKQALEIAAKKNV